MIFALNILGVLIILNKSLYKGNHLTIEDRLVIEYGLDENYTLKEITERVKKRSKYYL